MRQDDPVAQLAETNRTATLLRAARSVLCRIDMLAKTASASDDSSLPVITDVRIATERLVALLGHRQQSEQRLVKQATRRGR